MRFRFPRLTFNAIAEGGTGIPCLLLLASFTALIHAGCSSQDQQAEDLVRSALKQQKSGNYEDAIRTITRSVALKPTFPEAFYLRGTCYGVTMDFDRAIDDLRLATRQKPDWDRAWWALGNMYRAEGRNDEALNALNLAVKLNANATDALLDRALVLDQIGDVPAATADYKRASELDPRCVAAHLGYGIIRIPSDTDGAIKSLSTAIKLAPKNGESWLYRGIAHGVNEAHDRSLPDLSVACRLMPDNPVAWHHRGRALRMIGQPRDAVQDLQQALTLLPGDAQIQEDLTLAEADVHASNSIVTNSQPKQPRTSAVSMPEVLDDAQSQPVSDFPLFPLLEEEEEEETLVVEAPSEPAPQLPEGFALFGVDEEPTETAMAEEPIVDAFIPLEASQEPLESVVPEPEPVVDVETLYNRALAAYRDDDTAACIASLELLLEADPGHRAAGIRYASVLFEQNRKEDALAQLDTIVGDAQEDGEAIQMRSEFLKSMGRTDESIAGYTTLISLRHNTTESLSQRAEL